MRILSRSMVLLSSTRELGRMTMAWSPRPLLTKARDSPWSRESTTTKIATTTPMAPAVLQVLTFRCQRLRQL